MPQNILFRIDGFIAVITLNNPEKLNALTTEDLFRLGSLLEEIAEMPDIYATLITGNGRYFSSGANLGSLGSADGSLDDKRKYWLEHLASHNMRNCKAFYEHPKILIFALNGPVIGYPACLAAFADVVFSVENATFSTPFASLGLVAEGVSSYAFTQRLGMTKATEALVFGKRLSARELLDCGFFNKIFPQQKSAAEFHDVVLKEIRSMFSSGLDKQSMLEIKNLIRSPYLKVLDEQNMTEAMLGWRRFVKGIPQAHFKNLNVGTRKNNSSRL